jgi:hypothetical protein
MERNVANSLFGQALRIVWHLARLNIVQKNNTRGLAAQSFVRIVAIQQTRLPVKESSEFKSRQAQTGLNCCGLHLKLWAVRFWPVNVVKVAAFFVSTFVGVSTKVVALSL